MKSTRGGFTLLETVVALALASAGLAAVYQVYSSSARAEQSSNETERAARIAEFLLLTTDGGASGETDGFSWTMDVSSSPDWEGLETLTLNMTTPSGREIELSLDRTLTSEEPR